MIKTLFVLLTLSTQLYALDIIEKEKCSKLSYEQRFRDLKYVTFCDYYLSTKQIFYYIENIEGVNMLSIYKDSRNSTLDTSIPRNLLLIERIKATTDSFLLDIPIHTRDRRLYREFLDHNRSRYNCTLRKDA